MKTISFLIITCLGPLSFGADSIDYDSSITFAQDRGTDKISKEKTVFCLGPEQVEEIYNNGGKEDKKIARFARLFDIESIKAVGQLLSYVDLIDGASYQVCIYRSDSKKLLVQVSGETSMLRKSQFLLKSGDLLIIQPQPKDE